MLVKTFAGAVQGIESQTITVEINVGGTPNDNTKGLYFMVGLPDKAVSEGWQRIESALKNSKLEMPRLKW